ncbi:hypothetical protein CVT25_006769 [Psilocybe cyanescens]|uniref:T6SS Phospholipase effector Tle1-like catalytic domain-containing protein n=1 Tax=Psilocybe cyanescens TaxID=93625 RepID=A0A409X7L0_PSICY|nr:hypothetical protein CVT25_006769 [Psilocybe cyanescens]
MSTDETTPLLNRMKSEEKGDIPTYPPTHEGGFRTLILLFDGTGDKDDEDISNVVALKNMLHPEKDPKKQLIYYQTGIGTYNPYFPGLKTKIPLITDASRKLDGAVAWSLDHHVVGFSRGAYTARAVSAMINKVGLLPQSRRDQAWPAYESFTSKGKDTWEHSAVFRKKNESRGVIIEFLGVWSAPRVVFIHHQNLTKTIHNRDTVNSVGMINARKLPFTASNGSVKTFRHAVALDEHRSRFRSNMWNPPKSDPKKQPQPLVTDVDQVWFAGAHCDVGGGSVPNGTRPNLAHIALRWMVRECFKAKNGMMFNPAGIRDIGIDPDTLYPAVKTRPAPLEPTPDLKLSSDNIIKKPGVIKRVGSWLKGWFTTPPKPEKPDYSVYKTYDEEQLDLVDALAPIYDQLVINKAKWWILENTWLKGYSVQEKRDVWRRNLGRGRTILPPLDPDLTDPVKAAAKNEVPLDPRWAKLRVHRTVRTRMAYAGDDKIPRYIPKALMNGETTLDKLDSDLIKWVD